MSVCKEDFRTVPIRVIENDGLRRIEVLVQRVSDPALGELCENLADELVRDLSTVPWGGNIKRGLTYRTELRKTPRGFSVGVGSLEILHREKAPEGTIAAFLKWYTARTEERRAQEAKSRAARREAAGQVARTEMSYRKQYRKSYFEQMRITRARDEGHLTKEMILREEGLAAQLREAEHALDPEFGGSMSVAAYDRLQMRYEGIFEAEYRRHKRRKRRGR